MVGKKRFRFLAFKLCGLMIIIFILQYLFGGFTQAFLLNSNSISEPWRFVTSIFLHGGIGHLFYNLFALGFFGFVLERLVGSNRFLIVFFVSGVLANLVSVNFYSSSLGASGAIFGIIGAVMFIRPGLPVWAFSLPMPMFLAGILWGLGDLIGAAAFLSGNPISNTGNIAHLSGMFFGFVIGGFYRNWKNVSRKKGRVIIDDKYMRKWENYYMKDV